MQYQPKYPGSNDYILFPLPIIAVQRFFLPGFGQVVGGEEKLRAFYMYPSFDFNGERKASDSNELAGTETVDWALELGVGLGYRYEGDVLWISPCALGGLGDLISNFFQPRSL